MKKYIPVLKRIKLFAGIKDEEIEALLSCLQAKLECFKRGEYVLRRGEYHKYITVLLEGKLHVQHDDYWGNRSIISVVGVGEMFGEAYAAPGSEALVNDVVALEDSVVVYLDINRVLSVCSNSCRFHTLIVANLFFAISEKNRRLVGKLGHMSKRSTREKLLSYLSEQAGRHNSSIFDIPFNRQQLADYLSVDRSAMSNELCKMRDEGLIVFEKNKFTLLL